MIDKVIQHIDANRKASVERLNEFLRIPSISTEPERKADTRKAAEWVHRVFTGCGIKSEITETAGHPCILSVPIRMSRMRSVVDCARNSCVTCTSDVA